MQPNAPYQPMPQPQPQNDYSFITNPQAPSGGSRSLPGSGSPVARALIVVAGIFFLIILFNVGKGILSGGSNTPLFLGTVQDQQSMIHITTKAVEEQSITSTNKNFAITAQLGLASDQSKTATYLKKNGVKLNAKEVNLKLSASLDTQLADAVAASNYNAVFAQVMKTKLLNYDQALQQTNAKTTGAKGRALLKSEHNNTQLLLKQLEAANQ